MSWVCYIKESIVRFGIHMWLNDVYTFNRWLVCPWYVVTNVEVEYAL